MSNRRLIKRLIALFAVIAALGPGWIIPRIAGTILFLRAPSWGDLIALVSWWTVVPLLWIVAYRRRARLKHMLGWLFAWLLSEGLMLAVIVLWPLQWAAKIIKRSKQL